ncbi:ABC transporter permease [Alkalihalobacillus trypoxylicola]|uniref:Protein lplB n=1 Tax=Alkalihalobacillus trypoxylicola TaxID=519424 RepID=A0A161PIC0_9BACI|nr:sugar ABC transporter permease [Alkalihalobacillus trypoxylicola]KYG33028.1 protein lplB [Alkalihalobacillus trypoxylicola]GAF66700.1 sugar ABC transporter permease protein [Bacillus sp. TS-2]
MANSEVNPSSQDVIKIKKISKWQMIKRDRWLYFLLLPGLVWFILFKYVPMWGSLIAFQNYSPFLGFWGSEWVGFDHFTRLFENPDFYRVLRNTLMLGLYELVFVFPAPIILALLLNEIRFNPYKRTIQTLIYIPNFLSWVIVASLTYVFFTTSGGVVFTLIQSIFGVSVNILGDPDWFRTMIIGQQIWKDAGFGTIIFLAALTSVSKEQYEAAIVDGAGRFRRMWHVTLPAIRHVVVIMLILRMGNFLDQGFQQIYLMTNALNRSVADVFDVYIYFTGITQGAFSHSTAVGLFKGVVGIVLILLTRYIAKKLDQNTLF